AAEIEGERERDDSLAYGGGDVVPVNVLTELQRPPEHQGRETEREQNEPDVDPAADGDPFVAQVGGDSGDPNRAQYQPDGPESQHRAEGYMRPACTCGVEGAKHLLVIRHGVGLSSGPVFRNAR